MTEMSRTWLERDREVTGTCKDITGTWPGHERNMTETSPGQDQDISLLLLGNNIAFCVFMNQWRSAFQPFFSNLCSSGLSLADGEWSCWRMQSLTDSTHLHDSLQIPWGLGKKRQPQGNFMYIGLQYLPLNILNQRKAVRTFGSEDLCLSSMKSVEETNGSPSVSSSWEPKWRWPKSNYTMKVHLQQSNRSVSNSQMTQIPHIHFFTTLREALPWICSWDKEASRQTNGHLGQASNTRPK